ncbi:MAG TPA: trypsin-like peptidase domain-containing protein [Paracoccaceae bacterium]|nr:trypsin-like peptidase domain-containing protein [Paracoccaceae bacterium]
MLLRVLSLLLVLAVAPLAALADHNSAPSGKVWVQVSSHASLEEAVGEAQSFARSFEFARVFLTEDGSFVVALGVVDRREAGPTLSDLKRRRQIPRSTVTATGRDYLTELWFAKRAESEGSGYEPELAEALAREERMSEADRLAVQEALVWTGDYGGTLDGVFGPMTRAAIRRFQLREGGLVTGYLTREDQYDLFQARESRLQATGWRVVEDGPLGIRVGLPAALFGEVEALDLGKRLSGRGPAGGALLSLLSIPGGRQALDNLFEAARAELARDRNRYERRDADTFVVSGRTGNRVLYSFARRFGDDVRGFVLSHDASQTDLLGPVAAAMRASFLYRPVAARPLLEDELGLPPAAREEAPRTGERAASGIAGQRPQTPRPGTRRDPDETPARPARPRPQPDTAVRPDAPRPPRDEGEVDSTGSGFYVSLDGKILTNHHVVDGCRRMVVDGTDEARVVATDEEHDLALLDHRRTRSEAEVARFTPAEPRLNADVTVVGYPLYGLLGGLNVTRGVVSSLAGLRGDQTFIQISAAVQPGNSGGPAVDDRGYVIGVVQSKLDALRLSRISGDIPQNINFAVRGQIAQEFLRSQGVEVLVGPERVPLAPADLADEARRFTVLLECIK